MIGRASLVDPHCENCIFWLPHAGFTTIGDCKPGASRIPRLTHGAFDCSHHTIAISIDARRASPSLRQLEEVF